MSIATYSLYTTGGSVGCLSNDILRIVRQGAWWGMSLCLMVWLSACGSAGSSGSSAKAAVSGENAEAVGSTNIVTSVGAMQKGDLYLVDLSTGKATIVFSSGKTDATYKLVVQSTSTAAGNATVTVGDVNATPTTQVLKSIAVEAPKDAQESLDRMLREAEQNLPRDPVVHKSMGKAVSKVPAVGDTDTFRVLSSLATTKSYKTVTATVQCISAINADMNVVLYVEDVVKDAFTSAQIKELCREYASSLAAEFSVLGYPSDINGDGSVAVVATKVVNEIGGQLGGIVTGFFFGGDLNTRTESGNPASNAREVVYHLVPDPTGKYGTAITADFAMTNLLPAVVPHEVQHLLSYHSHVIEGNSGAEASWLNEALSHLVEDVVGYGQENPSRIQLMLASISNTGLITSGAPGLAARGASYLFLRFLYEQSKNGNNFLSAMVHSTETGSDNIVTAFNGQSSSAKKWNDLLLRWGVALAVSDQGVTTDSRYTYKSRSYDSQTSHWQGVCLVCNADDGRNTSLSGPTQTSLSGTGTAQLAAGANAIYDISSPPSSLSVQGNSEMQGVLIRTK